MPAQPVTIETICSDILASGVRLGDYQRELLRGGSAPRRGRGTKASSSSGSVAHRPPARSARWSSAVGSTRYPTVIDSPCPRRSSPGQQSQRHQ